MNKWNNQERAAIVELYFAHGHSIVQAQRAYRRKFNVRIAPSKGVIRRCIEQFRAQGNVADKARSGRPKSSRTGEKVERVHRSLNKQSPEISTSSFPRTWHTQIFLAENFKEGLTHISLQNSACPAIVAWRQAQKGSVCKRVPCPGRTIRFP